MINKRNKDKLNFMEIENFWPIKDTVKRMKGQTTDQGKLFAKHMSYKGLVSRRQKELTGHL